MMAAEGERIILLRCYGTGRLFMVLEDGYVPLCTLGRVLIGLVRGKIFKTRGKRREGGREKERKGEGGRELGWNTGESWREVVMDGYDRCTLYKYMARHGGTSL